MPRPRFQFRLRTLFVVVTIVAILCPFGVRFVRRWQAQRELQRQLAELVSEMNRPSGGMRALTRADSKRLRWELAEPLRPAVVTPDDYRP